MQNLLNLGKTLSKTEQKSVLGGSRGFSPTCRPTGQDCGNAHACPLDNICVLGTCQCP